MSLHTEIKFSPGKRRPVLRELFYITHVNNLRSILERGILSHEKIDELGLSYERIYNKEIVSRRQSIIAPNGETLWSFANLYFQPRNPMLYTVLRNNDVDKIAVVGVDKSILDGEDIFLTNGNAAHSLTEFFPPSKRKSVLQGIINQIDRKYWNEVDGSKRTIMAECLVSDLIPPEYLRDVYFARHLGKYQIEKNIGEHRGVPFLVTPGMFFQPIRSSDVTSTLWIIDGDMFFSLCQTLTISVNIVGVMGKGVASRAKYQFPDVYVKYQDYCRNRQLKMGKPVLYKREVSFDHELADEPSMLKNGNGETWFLLFPTKRHWSEQSNIRDIEAGLKWIVDNYKENGIKSLALPALGCGLGGLKWEDVGPLICQYLADLDIPVNVYLPAEKFIADELITSEFLVSKQRKL